MESLKEIPSRRITNVTISKLFRPFRWSSGLFGASVISPVQPSMVAKYVEISFSAVMFTLSTSLTLYRIVYIPPRLSPDSPVSHSVNSIQQMLSFIVLASIYYQTLFHKSHIHQIFTLLTKTDEQFLQLNTSFRYENFLRKVYFEIVFVFLYIYGAFAFFIVHFGVYRVDEWVYELFSAINPMVLTNLTLLTFINFCWHIKSKFSTLRLLLNDLCQFDSQMDECDVWKVKSVHDTTTIVFKELKKIARIYELLYETVQTLNKIFGVSNLASLALLSISLTCHVFLLFKVLTENSQTSAIGFDILGRSCSISRSAFYRKILAVSALWIFLFLSLLVYVTVTCHLTGQEARNIITIIYETISGKPVDDALLIDVRVLRVFSIQLSFFMSFSSA